MLEVHGIKTQSQNPQEYKFLRQLGKSQLSVVLSMTIYITVSVMVQIFKKQQK